LAGRLTQIREKILRFIASQKSQTGVQPTVRDIMSFMGYKSTNAVSVHISALIKYGYLLKVPGRARNLHLTEKAELALGLGDKVPLIGTVSAGTGVLAEENVDSYLPDLGGGGEFVLKVRGESMKDAGIYQDDLVYVDPKADPKNGDVVVALMEQEATVKVYRNNGDEISLIPRNQEYPTIKFGPDEAHKLKIVGVVKHLLRKY